MVSCVKLHTTKLNKGGDTITDRIDENRSIQIVGYKRTGNLINYKIKVAPELFTYKTKEEIADMIERTIANYKERNK